jgi:tetratricopeptide (TPR) repeat protein
MASALIPRQPESLDGPRRSTRLALAVLTISVGLGGPILGVWPWLRSIPSLDDAIALAGDGQLDAAEAKVRARLAADPDDGAAHLLMAQIILKRPDPPSSAAERSPSPSGRVALEHLARVRPRNPTMAVMFHLARGNALARVLRLDEAEAAWLAALRVDPAAAEVGWNLLSLYYAQSREEEARRLALRLYRVEPDLHDRASLLLELLRPDARPPAPGSVIKVFGPVLRHHPGEFHSALALGLARTRANQVEEGIAQLRRVVQSHPDRVEAWDGLLTGLDESGQVDLMEEELEQAPSDLSGSPRLLKHRARVAQGGNRWKEAVDLYRRARAAEPFNRVVEYRLSRALRHVGETAEADRIEQRVRRRDVAIQDLRPLYDRATDIPDLGVRPYIDLYQRIADARERMQLLDEARAWHRLVLGHDPKNEISLAALARLGEERDLLSTLVR